MATENYRALLIKGLDDLLRDIKPLRQRSVALTKAEEESLLANARIINDLKKARTLLKTDFEKAAALIATIPYYLKGPGEHLKPSDKFIGSDAVYNVTDTLRHYVRMIDCTRGGGPGDKAIWNNVMVIG